MAGERTSGLANAVLRRIAEAGDGWVAGLPPALRHSYPDWVMEEWTAMLGEGPAGELAEAQNEPPELCVRVNTLKAEEIDLGVPVRLDPQVPEARVLEAQVDVGASRELAEGLIWPQSQGVDAPSAPARPRAGDAGARPVRGAGREVGAAGGVDGGPGRAGVRRAAPRAGGGAARDA